MLTPGHIDATVFGSLAALMVTAGWLAHRGIGTSSDEHAAGGPPPLAAGGVPRPAPAVPAAVVLVRPGHSITESRARHRSERLSGGEQIPAGPGTPSPDTDDDEAGLSVEDTDTLAVFRAINEDLAADDADETLADLPAVHRAEAETTAQLLARADAVLAGRPDVIA